TSMTGPLLVINYFSLFFFFSSRRRHTRSKRDWSSDVCSSDLVTVDFSPSSKESPARPPKVAPFSISAPEPISAPRRMVTFLPRRSEERRVGREWGGGRWVVGVEKNRQTGMVVGARAAEDAVHR